MVLDKKAIIESGIKFTPQSYRSDPERWQSARDGQIVEPTVLIWRWKKIYGWTATFRSAEDNLLKGLEGKRYNQWICAIDTKKIVGCYEVFRWLWWSDWTTRFSGVA